MMSSTPSKSSFLLLTVLLALYAPNAWAYLDPASGSLLLQLIVGGVAGLFVAIKMYWRKVRAALGFKTVDEADDDGASDRAKDA